MVFSILDCEHSKYTQNLKQKERTNAWAEFILNNKKRHVLTAIDFCLFNDYLKFYQMLDILTLLPIYCFGCSFAALMHGGEHLQMLVRDAISIS